MSYCSLLKSLSRYSFRNGRMLSLLSCLFTEAKNMYCKTVEMGQSGKVGKDMERNETEPNVKFTRLPQQMTFAN